MTKKTSVTAAELLAKLNRDPAYRRKIEERAKRQQQRKKAYDQMLAPYLRDINRRGYAGASLEEVIKNHSPLPPPIIQILLSSLVSLKEPRVLESVVRALAAADHSFDGKALVQCFESTNDESLKWAIVNTVALRRPTGTNQWETQLRNHPYWDKTFRELGRE